MLARVAAATIILLAACSNGFADAPIRSTYEFQFLGPVEDLPDAQAAANEWNRCGVIAATVTADRGDIPILKVTAFPTQPSNIVGLTQRNPLRFSYKDGPYSRQQLMAHEMGHVFGLNHYGEGLMYPTLRPDQHVTDADCSHLRSAHFWTPPLPVEGPSQ